MNAGSDSDLHRLHELLRNVAERQGGLRMLRECSGRDGWPSHGVYFFYEHGEVLDDGQPRVVRVGTHALTATSRTTLWTRLGQHRGNLSGSNPGGGNHRGSVFRLHVGTALLNRGSSSPVLLESWLGPNPIDREAEAALEREVSAVIGSMPFTWVALPTAELRGYVERNAIALLAGARSSPNWLGRHAASEAVRTSGLWNVNHVNGSYDKGFLLHFRQAMGF